MFRNVQDLYSSIQRHVFFKCPGILDIQNFPQIDQTKSSLGPPGPYKGPPSRTLSRTSCRKVSQSFQNKLKQKQNRYSFEISIKRLNLFEIYRKFLYSRDLLSKSLRFFFFNIRICSWNFWQCFEFFGKFWKLNHSWILSDLSLTFLRFL